MALSSSRPHHLLRPLVRGFHASAQALARAEPHEFSKPSSYLGSWEPTGEPREAWAQLDRLRKGYARDVRQLRREYAYEVQLMEAERQRKAEARAEAARVANEERKAAKAAAAQTRAAERRAFEEDFRQALMKERAEKLESWQKKEKLREQKKAEQKELLLASSNNGRAVPAAFHGVLATVPTATAPQPQPEPEPEVKPSDTDALPISRHGVLAANWSSGDASAGPRRRCRPVLSTPAASSSVASSSPARALQSTKLTQ
ncbi:hypothetical protein C2845_PM18G00620 [Panicum miliaceum]|uniref:Uncharacterized protein n=1 Tax=Panicum miliaceum TaxID=4540 RepID=A0A3L6PKN6_PANMI|nr:hypothetical protein C2845_PM18G00620 [Panicum miliaceum]